MSSDEFTVQSILDSVARLQSDERRWPGLPFTRYGRDVGLPVIILHPDAARACGLLDGDTVQVPNGCVVGGAGHPMTLVTRTMVVMIDTYIPAGEVWGPPLPKRDP